MSLQLTKILKNLRSNPTAAYNVISFVNYQTLNNPVFKNKRQNAMDIFCTWHFFSVFG